MANYSYTKLRTLEECGQQYHLKYVKKVQVPQEQTTYFVGRVVHAAIHIWTAVGYPADGIETAIQRALRDETALLATLSRGRVDTLTRQVTTAATSAARIYQSLAFQAHEALIEERFTVPFPGRTGDRFNGAVDVYDPVTKTIYDLKCYREGSTASVKQLTTYAMAELLLGREVEHGAFIYPLHREPVVVVAIDRAAVHARLHDQIAVLAKTQRPLTFERGDHCIWCGFRNTPQCPATYTPQPSAVDLKTIFTGVPRGRQAAQGAEGPETPV